MVSEDAPASEGLRIRTYPLLHQSGWHAWIVVVVVASITLLAIEETVRTTLSPMRLLGVWWLPILCALCGWHWWRQSRKEQGEIVLEPSHLVHPGHERIGLATVTELREFGTVLELRHESISVPLRWSLKRSQLSQEDWEPFTTELKRRVRRANPDVRVYDAHTGPPPARV